MRTSEDIAFERDAVENDISDTMMDIDSIQRDLWDAEEVLRELKTRLRELENELTEANKMDRDVLQVDFDM